MNNIEDISCMGCLSNDIVFPVCKTCGIKNCCKEKGISNCSQCDDFPCDRIENFPLEVGKKVILRVIPYWRKHGTEKWVHDEESRYFCPECKHKLFRGAKRCNKCKNPVNVDNV